MTAPLNLYQSRLDRIRARFLRSMQSDIQSFILPNLTSGDASERAGFIGLMLSRFASDSDATPAALAELRAAFADEVEQSLALLGQLDPAEATRMREIADRYEAAAIPAAEQVFAFRSLLGESVRVLAKIAPAEAPGAMIRQRLDAIAALEYRWCDAQAAATPIDEATAAAEPSVYERITPEAVTTYLRQRYSSSPDIAANGVNVLPGGRSKNTIFLSVTGTSALPPSFVMRQDTGSAHMGTSVVHEQPILQALAASGLPIPEILHFEPERTALGHPFLLMRRLPGRPTGSFFAFSGASRELLIETARALAGLHRLDPKAIGLVDDDAGLSPGERLGRLVESHWQQWRDSAIEPSPLIDYGFDWMLRQCDGRLLGNAVIHGDYRPHNLLGEGDRLTGILDWEFTHIGDPAEDLAYIRPTVTPFMPWSEFITHYQAAGGIARDESILRLFDVWGTLRLAALGAGAVRGFMDGATDDFTQGAGGYFVIPMFEKILAKQLRQVDA